MRMVNRTLANLALGLLLLQLLWSCNESNSLSITQAMQTSRAKSEKTWRQAEVAYSSAEGEERKVDFVFLIANDGLHIVSGTTDQSDEDFLSKATVANNDNTYGVTGLIRNIYIPSGYSSEKPCVVMQTVANSIESDSMRYYVLGLPSSTEKLDPEKISVKEISISSSYSDFQFVSRSSVNSSNLIMYRKRNVTDSDNGKYEHHIGKWKIDDGNLCFESIKKWSGDILFHRFWEDGDSVNAAVLYYTSGDDDIQEQEYCTVRFSGDTASIKLYPGLRELAIRNFVTYSDASFMGLTQSGYILHSAEENRTNYYTTDSTFSFYRHVAPAVFRHAGDGEGIFPAVTVFARYYGSGFIIYCYNKFPSNDVLCNLTDEYRGHVQTTGFAESFRSEDISHMYPISLKLKDDNDKVQNRYKILVLSVENGLTTYTFDSLAPPQMRSNGYSSDGKVDVFN